MKSTIVQKMLEIEEKVSDLRKLLEDEDDTDRHEELKENQEGRDAEAHEIYQSNQHD